VADVSQYRVNLTAMPGMLNRIFGDQCVYCVAVKLIYFRGSLILKKYFFYFIIYLFFLVELSALLLTCRNLS